MLEYLQPAAPLLVSARDRAGQFLALLDLWDPGSKIDLDIAISDAVKYIYVESGAFVGPQFKFMTKSGVLSLSNTYVGTRSYNASDVMAPNVLLGRYCSIAVRTHVGATQHAMNWLTTGVLKQKNPDEPAPAAETVADLTILGNDVWVGSGAVIIGGRGLHIGHGAVIAANAVVTKSVPPYAIVAGVPARVIGSRFPPEIVERLLASKWWRLPQARIAALPYWDIEATLTELEAERGAAAS